LRQFTGRKEGEFQTMNENEYKLTSHDKN